MMRRRSPISEFHLRPPTPPCAPDRRRRDGTRSSVTLRSPRGLPRPPPISPRSALHGRHAARDRSARHLAEVALVRRAARRTGSRRPCRSATAVSAPCSSAIPTRSACSSTSRASGAGSTTTTTLSRPAGRRTTPSMTGFGSYRNFGALRHVRARARRSRPRADRTRSRRVRGRRPDLRRRREHQVVHHRAARRRCSGRPSCPTPRSSRATRSRAPTTCRPATRRSGRSRAPPTAPAGPRSTRARSRRSRAAARRRVHLRRTPTAYRFYRFDLVPKAGVSHFQVAEIAPGRRRPRAAARSSTLSSPSGALGRSTAGADLTRSVDGDPPRPGGSPSRRPACSGSSTSPPASP